MDAIFLGHDVPVRLGVWFGGIEQRQRVGSEIAGATTR